MTQTDELITRSVRGLIGAFRMSIDELGRDLGMTRRTMYRRASEGGWTAAEVALIADYFGVEVADLYSGRVDLAAADRHPFVEPEPVTVPRTRRYQQPVPPTRGYRELDEDDEPDPPYQFRAITRGPLTLLHPIELPDAG